MTKTTSKSIYRLNDSMFRFWYRFVPQNLSKIHLGQGSVVFESIEPQISSFMGEVFEHICKEWLWRENFANSLPFSFQDCGRWWGTNPKKRSEQEIDIIAYEPSIDCALFCECKWTNEKISENLLCELIDKSDMFGHKEKFYYIFSKSGFTANAQKRAAENIKLISFNEMF